MQSIYKKTLLPLLALTAMAAPALAADAAPAAEPATQYNMTLISLVSLMLVLLFVIGVLGSILRQLGFVVRDKIRKERTGGTGKVVSVIVFLLASAFSFRAVAEDAAPAATQVSDSIDGIAANDFYTLVTVIVLELIVIFAMVIYINILLKVIKNVYAEEDAKATVAKRSWFWDKFNKAASIEDEKDVLLDHDYDGIHELDNSLPPWWKYGFYLTIVVAVVYLYRFHISHDAPSSYEEYVAEMEKGEADKAAYLAKSANNVDESNVTALVDGAALAAGKELFVKNCAACHLADGGGSVGPNLTDDYWLHGGNIKDIFKSIKYGWQDKGMKSWKDDFSPMQLQQLASFIKSIHGTKPATPKDPQGELYVEASAAPAAAAADTTAKKEETKKN